MGTTPGATTTQPSQQPPPAATGAPEPAETSSAALPESPTALSKGGQKLSAGAKKPEIASVIAAYQATGAEQLSLTPGQLIQVRKKSNSGWWEGELQARGQ